MSWDDPDSDPMADVRAFWPTLLSRRMKEEPMQGGPLKQCTCGTGPCGGIHAKWCDLWWQPARPLWRDLDPADRPILPWEAFMIPALIGFGLGVLAGYLLYVLTYA